MSLLNNLSIKSVGWAFVATLTVSGAMLVAGQLIIERDIHSIYHTWQHFEESRSEKSRLINALHSDLGYGGMIHHFKNFIIRGDRSLLGKAQQKLGAARIDVENYTALDTTPVEKTALGQIQNMLARYAEALTTAEQMLQQGQTPEEIDRAVSVDDGPALESLIALQRAISGWSEAPSQIHLRADVINALRRELGYGGIIHEFKNFVIRQDISHHVDLLQAKLTASFTLLDRYVALDVTAAEEEAIADIRMVLEQYQIDLFTAKALVAEGKTTKEIDRIVQIDDEPALTGLLVLNRAAVTEVERRSAALEESITFVHHTLDVAFWIALGLILFLVAASVWVIRVRIIGPIGELTGTMTRLAEGRLDTHVPGTGPSNEIGQMARAILVFKGSIKKREEAQAELRASEERFRELLEAAPDAMIIVNQQGEIVLVNKHAETIFGYAREALVGSPVEILISQDLREGHVEKRTAFAAEPRRRPMGQSADLFGVARDGRKFPVEISLVH